MYGGCPLCPLYPLLEEPNTVLDSLRCTLNTSLDLSMTVNIRCSSEFTRNQFKQIIFLFLPVDEDWFLSKLWKNLLNTLIFILDLTIGQLHDDVIFFTTTTRIFEFVVLV